MYESSCGIITDNKITILRLPHENELFFGGLVDLGAGQQHTDVLYRLRFSPFEVKTGVLFLESLETPNILR